MTVEKSDKLRIAAICGIYHPWSHADAIITKFLKGMSTDEGFFPPKVEVVSLYIDHVLENDIGIGLAQEYGVPMYPSLRRTLHAGGSELGVDGVLLIGEHGDYPHDELGRKMYPRRYFFEQIAGVFAESGRSVPVFNDKHLSYSFGKAQRMVAVAEKLRFPLLAGSSLPVTFRLPPLELPLECEIEDALMIGVGGSDAMDYHALEAMQCMLERRRGGETGIAAVQLIDGDEVWRAGEDGRWSRRLLEGALARSDSRSGIALTDGRPQDLAHNDELQELVENPSAYFIEYNDGTRATLLLLSGAVSDWTFAAQVGGEVFSTQFLLPPQPNVTYSACLMAKAEEMFASGVAPYPVQRTLLVCGMLERCLESRVGGHVRLATPELDVCYRAPQTSQFCGALQ